MSDVVIRLPAGRPQVTRILDETFDRRVDLRAIAVMRVLIGAVVIRHLWPEVSASVLPVERFHVPWWSWLPVPSPGIYRTLLWLGVVAGAAMVAGLAARAATVTAFAVVTYLVFVDMTAFAHNRAFLVWMLFGLALVPARGARSILHPTAPVGDAQGPWWPLLLMRIVVSSVYLTSGGTKLFNPDWRSGRVLLDRMTRAQHLIPFDGALHDLVLSRAFHHVLSPTAIAVELFLGVGLWLSRTRMMAIWVALAFHLSIEFTASVQTFSYTAISALLLWVTPAARDRRLTAGRRLTGVVRRLDWLDRFDIAEPTTAGSPARLVDRDGTVREGRAARLTALSRLPLLFAVVAPVLALDRIRRWPGGESAEYAAHLQGEMESERLLQRAREVSVEGADENSHALDGDPSHMLGLGFRVSRQPGGPSVEQHLERGSTPGVTPAPASWPHGRWDKMG